MAKRPTLDRLGELIRAAREEAKKTQATAAADLRISEPYLWRIENGKQIPSRDLLKRICDEFDLDSGAMLDMLRAVKARRLRDQLSEEFDGARS